MNDDTIIQPSTEGAQPSVSSPELTAEAEPLSDLVPESAPEPTPQPKPPDAPQVSDIKPQVSESVHPPEPTLDIQPSTFDVGTLSDNDLKAAAALWAKKNQAEFSKKGVAKRKQTMELNLREIVDYLSLNNGAPLPRIARHTNITPGTTSKYLRQLIAAGKVRGEGWAKDRRYYLK